MRIGAVSDDGSKVDPACSMDERVEAMKDTVPTTQQLLYTLKHMV